MQPVLVETFTKSDPGTGAAFAASFPDHGAGSVLVVVRAQVNARDTSDFGTKVWVGGVPLEAIASETIVPKNRRLRLTAFLMNGEPVGEHDVQISFTRNVNAVMADVLFLPEVTDPFPMVDSASAAQWLPAELSVTAPTGTMVISTAMARGGATVWVTEDDAPEEYLVKGTTGEDDEDNREISGATAWLPGRGEVTTTLRPDISAAGVALAMSFQTETEEAKDDATLIRAALGQLELTLADGVHAFVDEFDKSDRHVVLWIDPTTGEYRMVEMRGNGALTMQGQLKFVP